MGRGGRLSGLAFALVLASALLHAGWNFAMKRAAGDLPTVRAGLALAAFAAAPFGIYYLARHPPPAAGWLCIASTGVAHAAYFALLASLYRTGDLSSVYPLSRGIGVAFAALGATLLLGEAVHPGEAAGIALVVTGIVAAGGGGLGGRGGRRKTAAVGLVIAAFALVDKTAVAYVHPVAYIWTMFLLSAVLLPASGAAPADLRAARMIGPGSMASYLLMLFAYRAGPLGPLIAAREVSVVFGAALGFLLLREPVPARRLAGLVLVVAGLVLLRLFA